MGGSTPERKIKRFIKIFSRLFQKNMMDMKHSVTKNSFMHLTADILSTNISFGRAFILFNKNIDRKIKQLGLFQKGQDIKAKFFCVRYGGQNTKENHAGYTLLQAIQPDMKNSS